MFNPHTALMSAWRASLTFCAAAGCTVAVAADWVEPRTALDRAGVYHAGFDLRVADKQGRPVAATVAVCQTGQRCDNTNGRLAMAMTDERGQVAFRDLSSSRSLQIFVESPEQLRPRYLQFEELTNANANLGTLRLKLNRVITGTVRQVTHRGAPPTVMQSGRVTLWGVDELMWLGTTVVDRDGWFRLADFDIEPDMEIEFNDHSSRTLRAPLGIDPERSRYHFDLVADRVAGIDGLLRVVESRDVPPEHARPTPVATEATPHRIDLRLVATDGMPITGATVSVVGVQGAESVTDAQGRLSMTTEDAPEVLFLHGPWGIVSIGPESPKDRTLLWGRPPDVVAGILGQSEVQIPVLRRVRTRGVGPPSSRPLLQLEAVQPVAMGTGRMGAARARIRGQLVVAARGFAGASSPVRHVSPRGTLGPRLHGRQPTRTRGVRRGWSGRRGARGRDRDRDRLRGGGGGQRPRRGHRGGEPVHRCRRSPRPVGKPSCPLCSVRLCRRI